MRKLWIKRSENSAEFWNYENMETILVKNYGEKNGGWKNYCSKITLQYGDDNYVENLEYEKLLQENQRYCEKNEGTGIIVMKFWIYYWIKCQKMRKNFFLNLWCWIIAGKSHYNMLKIGKFLVTNQCNKILVTKFMMRKKIKTLLKRKNCVIW